MYLIFKCIDCISKYLCSIITNVYLWMSIYTRHGHPITIKIHSQSEAPKTNYKTNPDRSESDRSGLMLIICWGHSGTRIVATPESTKAVRVGISLVLKF